MRELHLSERQFEEEMSPGIIQRLAFVIDQEHKKAQLQAGKK